VITFLGEGENYTYRTTDYNLFQQAFQGSKWVIKINGFGDVTEIKPD